VKIAHPSQFRRFLADGKYGSDKQYLTTEMAASVNAVTASNADFYKHRKMGIIVNNGEVNRVDSRVDTCYIDDKGDLLFTYQGEIKDLETAQKFVEENNVRFSLAFGPVLVDNYEKVVPDYYPLGEIRNIYSRAGLGKLDDLHYLLVAVNEEKGYWKVPNMALFADQMMLFGCEKAYALDGGQTAAIVTNDKLINRPDYGNQRTVSDIIYFATAVPNGG
jgi:exopolysaccharide biosynthesis protein